MAELYNDLCATYLQSIWNRLYDRFGNYPNTYNPTDFDVITKTHLPYLRIFIVLKGKKYLYKKIRMYDKMVFDVNSDGGISSKEPLHLQHDLEKLISENIIII